MTSSDNRMCPSCGQPLAASASFCRHCGNRVDQVAQTPPAVSAPAPATPQQQQQQQRKGPGTAILVAVLAGLLVGGGAVAAVTLLGGDDSEPIAVAPGSAATVPADETAPPTETGEADSESGPAGFPADSETEMAGEIQGVLLAYHEAVVARRFQDAWALLSARKRQQTEREDGYRAWVKAQASLSPYLSPAGLTARVDALDDEGVARVFITGMGWSAPDSPCAEWSGLTWAKYEGGTWGYDPGYSTTPERERTWKPRYGELLGANC